MATSFNKNYTKYTDLIPLLQSRGMTIANPKQTQSFLRRIGYYRLSAYFYPFLKQPKSAHQYRPGTRFEDALALYHFDRKLRLFTFNELEKIEIAVRTAMANIMVEETGDIFWLTNPLHYVDPIKYKQTIELINKEYSHSKEDFIAHFKNTYSESYPPAWILIEILPFGVLSRIYENLSHHKARKRIAQEFNLTTPIFNSPVFLPMVSEMNSPAHKKNKTRFCSSEPEYLLGAQHRKLLHLLCFPAY